MCTAAYQYQYQYCRGLQMLAHSVDVTVWPPVPADWLHTPRCFQAVVVDLLDSGL